MARQQHFAASQAARQQQQQQQARSSSAPLPSRRYPSSASLAIRADLLVSQQSAAKASSQSHISCSNCAISSLQAAAEGGGGRGARVARQPTLCCQTNKCSRVRWFNAQTCTTVHVGTSRRLTLAAPFCSSASLHCCRRRPRHAWLRPVPRRCRACRCPDGVWTVTGPLRATATRKPRICGLEGLAARWPCLHPTRAAPTFWEPTLCAVTLRQGRS
jgi:hypothetical protein